MAGKFRKYLSLPPEERRLFLEAWLTLGLMRAAILTLPFKRLTRDLKQSATLGDPPSPPPEALERAVKIGRAVERAAAHTPWESACLVQSLTARRMLHRRDIPGAFCLGVARESRSDDPMKAHAWTLCGDTVITGAAGHETFAVVSVFSWRGE